MNPGAPLLAEGCLLAAGFGLAALLSPARPVSRLEFAGISLALGAGVISLLLFVLGSVFQGPGLIASIALLSLLLGIAGIFRVRRFEWVSLPGSSWFLWGLLGLLLVVGWQAANHPLTADGLFNFEFRAQLAGAHGGRIPVEFFSDPSRRWMNPAYPLFLPMNQSWFYLCAGGPNQALLPLLSLHFAAAAACLLYSGVMRLTGESWRGGIAVGLLALLPSAMIVPGSAISMWADFPLAVLFLGAVIYLMEFAALGTGLVWLASLLALLPWAKREGIVLALVVALAALVPAWKRGQARQWGLACLPFLTAWMGWKVCLSSMHAGPAKDFVAVSWDAIAQHIDRLPFLAVAMGRELLAWERWAILWPLTLVAVVSIGRRPALARWRLLAPIIAVLLSLYLGIYLFSSWDSLALHVVTSLPRLLIPVAMPAILAIAAAIPAPFSRGKEREESPAA